MGIFAIIPARGGSKGIPNKNIYPLNGIPLIDHTINACVKSKLIDKYVVSTDSDLIISHCINSSTPYIVRPAELALDISPTLPAIQHAYYNFFESSANDLIVTLQPTSPLRKSEHIDNAIELITNSHWQIL